jgi:IclR family pca regulon transcriptional regulator
MLKSLARGLSVLHCFTPEQPSLPLKDIAELLDIPKGSAFRITSTLQRLGYLHQDPASKQYRLGVAVLGLGQTCLAGLVWPDVALPYLEELAQETRQSASMAILDETSIIYVARASTRRVMSSNLHVGSHLPIHCTSMGKALLAHLGEPERTALLDGLELTSYTQHTITDAARLESELESIRLRGYAISDQELELTLCSAAAPVRNGAGQVVAAINVSMLATQVTRDDLEATIAPRLLDTARAISNALGFRPGLRGNSQPVRDARLAAKGSDS